MHRHDRRASAAVTAPRCHGPDAEVAAAFERRTGPLLDFADQAADVVAAATPWR